MRHYIAFPGRTVQKPFSDSSSPVYRCAADFLFLPRGTDCKRPLIPAQPNTSVNPLGVRTRSRRHAILVLTGTFHQNRYLQRIQLATNHIRTHLMTQQPQSIPHMLHTAKRHIADGNVRPHPLWLPMVNRPDLQIMLVGAKTALLGI